MSNQFDIIVIGSGPGGYIAALKAAQLGASVAIIEQHPFFGGTCLNWGCIPSKALLATAELLHTLDGAASMGVKLTGQAELDWPAVQKRKAKVLSNLRGGIGSLFKARKVATFQGRGRLARPGKVTVTADNGSVTELQAGKIILAVGSVPMRIAGWPEDPNLVCTSDESLHWDELPSKLLIVGGGVIGCEFACMMQPMGVEVTLVEMMDRLLPEMEAELADELAKVFKRRKIAVHTAAKVEQVIPAGGGIQATLDSGEVIEADKLLVATGRKPATGELGLDTVGIETDRRGFIAVNERMETAAAGVYCIGDANGRTLLAHAASAQGVVAAGNALGSEHAFHAPIPWAVYTFPEIAGVGLTEKRAEEKNMPVSVGQFPVGHLGKAMAVGHTEGFVKTIRHRESGALLGVHMIGHNATEIIHAATAMLQTGASTEALAEMVFAHPTMSEAVKESAEDALGQALHLPPRKVAEIAATLG
jgi:dihydrolipoamide dehydrogenase